MSHVEGLPAVLSNINGAMLDSIAKMNERMSIAGTFLHECVKARASLTDHTQEDLNNYSPRNPYSKNRFPEPDGEPHGDDGLVHRQSGVLYDDIQMVMSMDNGGLETNVAVGVPSSNPHIKNLIEGKPAQRPRPFIQRAFRESKDDIATILGGGLGG
jgi:hypothetical protein